MTPEGRIVQVHESTIFELQMALNMGDIEKAKMIADRMALIEERRALREAQKHAYNESRRAAANEDWESAKRWSRLMDETREQLLKLLV